MKNSNPVTHSSSPPSGERFVTKPELAALLMVSVRCITNMMRRGELAYWKIGGRLVRFQLANVERRLNETVLACEGRDSQRGGSNLAGGGAEQS